MVNSRKVLALIMGAIIAASVTSQMAVQVYAHDEESSSSSYSDDYLGDISFLDEEESSGSAEPMKEGLDVEELKKLTNFKSGRVNELLDDESLQGEDSSDLYVSTNKLVFKPKLNTEVKIVRLDEEREFNRNIAVPEDIVINGKIYSIISIENATFYDCENFENETPPVSATDLGDSAFDTDLIEKIDLVQRNRPNNNDIERAYGRQLGRMFIPVELNAEVAEHICPICRRKFNEEDGEVGRLPCGHYIHLECFEDQLKNNF